MENWELLNRTNRIKTDLDIYLMKNQGKIPKLHNLHKVSINLDILHKELKKTRGAK